MQKYLLLVLIVGLAQGSVLREDGFPRIKKYIIMDPPSVEVRWYTIEKSGGEPVLGYKARLYEVLGKTVYQYETVNGESKLVESYQPPDSHDDKAEIKFLTEIKVLGAQTDSVVFKNLKIGRMYEMRIVAFTSEGDGVLSLSPDRLVIGELSKNRPKDD